MKNKDRMVKRYTVYIMLAFVFAGLILAGIYLPRIVYGVYDDYQFNLSSNADKNLSDASQLNNIYEPDRAKRLAAYTGGVDSGKKYVTIETEITYDEELDNTIKNLIKELREQLLQTNAGTEMAETVEVISTLNKAVDSYSYFYTLADFVPCDQLLYMDSDYIYSCVDKSSCRKFMIYEETMSDGIAFSLLYLTIDMTDEAMGTDLKVELIGDIYDSTIYYVKFTYPESYLSGYDRYIERNEIADCFLGIMSNYYTADRDGEGSETWFIEDDEDSLSYGISLLFDKSALIGEIRMWYADEYKTGNELRLGLGIREIAKTVAILEIDS